MDGDREAARQDLNDLHDRLVEDYEVVDSLVGRPGLNPQINQAIAGLQYQIAKAAQTAAALLQDDDLWESG